MRSNVLAPCLLLAACHGPKTAPVPRYVEPLAINPLEVCETRNFSRYARGADCRGVGLLFLSRELAPGPLLEGTRQRLETYGFAPEYVTMHVNGQAQAAFRHRMGPADKRVLDSVFTAFAVPASSESIEAQCYVREGELDVARCEQLFDAFVAQGLLRGDWPRVLDDKPRHGSVVFELAGREVRLPNACDELAPYDVRCQEGHVHVLMTDDPEKLGPLTVIDLAVTKDETLHRERTVPCALEGVPTTCTLRRFRLPYSDELLSYRAAAVVRGQPILLSCDVPRSKADPQPGPICGQFFSFDEGALGEPELPEEPER